MFAFIVYTIMTKYVWFRAEPRSKTIITLLFQHDIFTLEIAFFFFLWVSVVFFMKFFIIFLFLKSSPLSKKEEYRNTPMLFLFFLKNTS